MSVVVVVILSTIIFYIYGSRDFAINMSIIWGCFIVLEAYNKIRDDKTISQKFWKWSEEQPRWKVWLVAGAISVVAGFFTLHLVYRI